MLSRSLQKFAVAASQRGLGFGSIAAVGGSGNSGSSSSSAVWLRGLADGAGDKPSGEAAPAAEAPPEAPAASGEPAAAGDAVAAASGAEEQPTPEDVPEALIDPHDGSLVPRELFTKRQLAWMGLEDPEKYKHFLPRLSRKELGSFADEYAAEEFDVEQELYPEVPENQPLYNLRDSMPEIYQNKTHLFDRLRRLKEEQYPDMPIEQFAEEVLGIDAPEEQPPRPGARRIIRWEVRHVFAVGTNEAHPANKKVKAWVHLRDLQHEHGLSDAALQHIARVCGPRYNPGTGELKLTSDRYPHREANRAHIRQIIDSLVEEGRRKFPAQQQQQQQAQAAP